jgi:site-specific DNA-methyltransferase (adenine-specific)
MESIKQFGFAQPLVVDKDNVLIIGHCRLIASKRLKLDKVPVVKMDELTQEQVDKLRLLDNKLNESEWDFDLLNEDIPTLDFSDFDIDWGLPEEQEENTKEERKDVNYNESISVVIECANDEEAEETFTKLSEMGYSCKISTL